MNTIDQCPLVEKLLDDMNPETRELAAEAKREFCATEQEDMPNDQR
jgi:hypothetical protein